MIFASKTSIEGEAVRQFEAALSLPGIRMGAGFPDLHPGRGVPVGAAFFSEGYLYPHLIGNDIGCGMGLFRLEIKAHKFKMDKVLRKLGNDPEAAIQEAVLRLDAGRTPDPWRSALGTIGHGNHFIEFLEMDQAYGEEQKDGSVFLLIHCGSRGYGELLWRKIAASHGSTGLEVDSADAQDYLAQSGHLIGWARYNRALVASAVAEMARSSAELVTDSTHNGIFAVEGGMIHRKGAAEIRPGVPVMTAGSRGTNSYLLQPLKFEENISSTAHGCGRKWQRGDARSRLKDRYSVRSLKKTALGSWVVCPDKDTLYEEAPEAYKNIGSIIADLEEFGLAVPAARFKPLLNIKP